MTHDPDPLTTGDPRIEKWDHLAHAYPGGSTAGFAEAVRLLAARVRELEWQLADAQWTIRHHHEGRLRAERRLHGLERVIVLAGPTRPHAVEQLTQPVRVPTDITLGRLLDRLAELEAKEDAHEHTG